MLWQRMGNLLDRFFLRPLPGPFLHRGGNCWQARLPRLKDRADCPSFPNRSPLVLFENRRCLKPGHASIPSIQEIGKGYYCHWEDEVLFSTSDNTDPNDNGRLLHYSLSTRMFRRHYLGFLPQSQPVNFRPQKATPQSLAREIEYTLGLGELYLQRCLSVSPDLRGKKVLEIGPGIHFGCVLYLACHGAVPFVADRFLAPWNPDYHPFFYEKFCEELARTKPQANLEPLMALIRARKYTSDVLGQYQCSAEGLSAPSNTFDFVFSHAVVEHLFDLEKAFGQFFRITKPGGWGFHQVDFRDHRHFELPLEYLLLSGEAFHELFQFAHAECGNRFRPGEMAALFRKRGFAVEFTGNCIASEEYLKSLLPRLRQAPSPYRDYPEEALQVLGGFFRLQKTL